MVSKYNDLDLMQARVNEVPDGWNFLPIARAFKIRNEFRKPISDEVRSTQRGRYPYYGPTKIQDFIDTYEQDGSYALIGEDGDHFLKYKTHSMTQLVDGKCTVNNHAHIIEGTALATRKWFYYYFMHRDIFSYLSRQGAGRYKLNKASLEKIYLLIPPLAEQQKIAQILSTWDKAIAVTEQLLANSQQQKKALMQQLLTGKKRLLEENGVRFEGEWRKQRLGSLLKEGKERNKDNSISRVLSVTNHSGFVLPENQFSKRIASDEVSHYKVVRKGQYGYNPSRINVGSFARLDQFSEGLLSPMYVVFSIDSVELDSDFFLYWMQSNEAQQRINNSTQGSVRDSVGFDAICSFLFKMPSLEEQKKISAVISASLQEIKLLETKLDYLQQEKKALMQQLLTGKRRVKIAV